MANTDGVPPSLFVGDLLLALARDGRLTLDAEQAQCLINGLERTIDQLRARVTVLDQCRSLPAPLVRAPYPAERHIVDALFADQLAPGRMEEALHELPKYVAALRRASRNPHP